MNVVEFVPRLTAVEGVIVDGESLERIGFVRRAVGFEVFLIGEAVRHDICGVDIDDSAAVAVDQGVFIGAAETVVGNIGGIRVGIAVVHHVVCKNLPVVVGNGEGNFLKPFLLGGDLPFVAAVFENHIPIGVKQPFAEGGFIERDAAFFHCVWEYRKVAVEISAVFYNVIGFIVALRAGSLLGETGGQGERHCNRSSEGCHF